MPFNFICFGKLIYQNYYIKIKKRFIYQKSVISTDREFFLKAVDFEIIGNSLILLFSCTHVR